jgi:hypothetical protein
MENKDKCRTLGTVMLVAAHLILRLRQNRLPSVVTDILYAVLARSELQVQLIILYINYIPRENHCPIFTVRL